MKEMQGAGGKGSKATKIDQSEITVVLQGSTLPEYGGKRCIELSALSVRKTMPHCKIIISTWEGEDIPQSVRGAVDKVIFNKDPGCFVRGNEKPNNVNRQLVSSLNGLKQAQTKYALKMRTDFVMKSTDFLNYFDVYNSFSESYRLFQKRLVCGMLYTKKPRGKFSDEAFHPADFFTFGLTHDLLKLYDIPLVQGEEFDWLSRNENCISTIRRITTTDKYTAEQSIWIGCLRKNGVDVKCEFANDVNDKIAAQSDAYLANNLYPVCFKKSGLIPLKSWLNRAEVLYSIDSYTECEWKKLYQKYCDMSFSLRSFDSERFTSIFVFLVYFPAWRFRRLLKRFVKLIRGEISYGWLLK